SFDRLFETQRQRMPIEMNRQAAQIEHGDQQRNEDQSLKPMIRSFSLGESANFRGDAEAQNHDENKDAEQVGNEIQDVFGARIRDRLFIALAGQRVLFGFRRLWRSFIS